jgi:hypothetical protein
MLTILTFNIVVPQVHLLILNILYYFLIGTFLSLALWTALEHHDFFETSNLFICVFA